MKNLLMFCLAVFFIYTLIFDIFLSEFFRIPTPIISCVPLILFFKQSKKLPMMFTKEILIFMFSIFLYNVVSVNDVISFTVNSVIFITTALYFNFFVGHSYKRFNLSILIFILLLLLSTIVMFLNQFVGSSIDGIRAFLIDNEVRQSPSGISATIFGFGYQLAPLVTFLFVYVCVKNKNIYIIASAFLFGLIAIYFGLQRSVLVGFGFSIVIFVVIYYRSKSLWVLAIVSIMSIFLYNYASSNKQVGSDNILAKSDRDGGTESRDGLVKGNLEIIANYPYGLILSGKKWTEVTRGNPAFPDGLTSHNAYLMYITYLGVVLGTALLLFLHGRIVGAFRYVYRNLHNPNSDLLCCLVFAFLAVFINAMFHNASIFTANGATVFLFFSILHFRQLLVIKGDDFHPLNIERQKVDEY